MVTRKSVRISALIVLGLILLGLCIYTIISLVNSEKAIPVQVIAEDDDQTQNSQEEVHALILEPFVSYSGNALPINGEVHASPPLPLSEVQVPILMYHHFVTDPSKENALCVSPEKFKSDLLALQLAGYETVSFEQLLEYVHSGVDLPERPIVITIDDGYYSNYEYAFPILKELGMKATIFIIGWSVGETKYKGTDRDILPHFGWEEAKEMVASGLIDIQNHSYDLHEIDENKAPFRKGVLQRKDEDLESYYSDLEADTLKLQELIESNLGYKANVFAYPYGLYSVLSEDILSSIGYEVTLTTKSGINAIQWQKPENLFALKRFNVSSDLSSEELIKLIQY